MSQYEIFITPRAWREVKELPGNLRQRIRRDITDLANTPRPSNSKALAFAPDEEQPSDWSTRELRRLRIERWRVVYTITEENRIIDILTIRSVRHMIMGI